MSGVGGVKGRYERSDAQKGFGDSLPPTEALTEKEDEGSHNKKKCIIAARLD